MDGKLDARSTKPTDCVSIGGANRNGNGNRIGLHDATAVSGERSWKLRNVRCNNDEHHGANYGGELWNLHYLDRYECNSGYRALAAFRFFDPWAEIHSYRWLRFQGYPNQLAELVSPSKIDGHRAYSHRNYAKNDAD